MGESTRNDFSGIAHGPVVQAGTISGGVHLHFHGTVPDDPMPRQTDFSGYLEHKRRDFTGRRWLFNAVQLWMREYRERSLLITGDPGLGKSAFLAELVHRSSPAELLGFYFCVAEDRATLEPAAFVGHLTAMLTDRLPAYAELCDAPRYRPLLRRREIERDPAHALDQGVIAPLRQLPVSGERLIIVDGLDEAQFVDRRENILTLLAPRLERFPAWIRFILAARPDPQVLTRLGEARTLPIEAVDEHNLDDVRKLIARRLGEPAWHARLASADMRREVVLDRLTAAARGNILYAVMVLRAIELGRCDLGDLDGLPPGLAGIYQLFLERFFPEPGSYVRVRPLMETMVAALAPLPVGVLGTTSGLDPADDLPSVLSLLATLMPGQGEHYAFYHHSLTDWLTESYHPFHVDLRSGHTRLSRGFLGHLHRHVHDLTLSRPTEPDAGYWAIYGLDHLASGDRLPPDLSSAAFSPVTVAAQDHLWALGAWTRNGLPPTMRRYVHDLLRRHAFEDIVVLLTLLKQVAMSYYVKDGLVRGRVEPDGHTVYEIGREGADGHKIMAALNVTGYAGAVLRAVKESSEPPFTTDQMSAFVDQLRTIRYMAGGFETAGWASGVEGHQGFLAAAGGALNRELHELTDGL